MSKMAALHADLQEMVAEVRSDMGAHAWPHALPDGATYVADMDFEGWAKFTGENEQLIYCVDTTTGLCYGPVAAGIVDLVLGYLVGLQTTDELPFP